MTMMKSMFSQVNLPDKKMIPGESYSVTTPLNLPIAGMLIKMNIVTTYKLIAASASTANFDVDMRYTFNMDVQTIPVSGGGSGSGTIVYDRINEYQANCDLAFQLKIGMKNNDVAIDIVMNAKTTQNCLIAPRRRPL